MARAGALLLAAVVAAAPSSSAAQVAPVGMHHATIGPGTGLNSPVSPTGGFSAAVPLELPSPRGGLPVPLSIQYTGTTRAGAAGSGWDIPLWSIRRSSTTWHRKPSATSGLAGHNHVPERVTMSLGGAPQLVVPGVEPGLYLPFIADEYMELRDHGDTWTLDTSAGHQYTFTAAASLGSANLPRLWLLTRISDRKGTDRVELRYEIGDRGCGQEVDLTGMSFAFDSSGRALHDVALEYAPVLTDAGDGSVSCLGRVDEQGTQLSRSRVVERVTVRSRNNLDAASGLRRVRAFVLGYGRDPDTALPRLDSVAEVGEEGSDETLPVARYRYGSSTDGARLAFTPAVDLPIPAVAAAQGAGLGVSVSTSSPAMEDTLSAAALRDFTGDGVPDYVIPESGAWRLFEGRLSGDGALSFAPSAGLTWSAPAALSWQRTYHPFGLGFQRPDVTTTLTRAQMIDWNGDGRVDIVESIEGDANHWRVWLNRPSDTAPIEWEPTLGAVPN